MAERWATKAGNWSDATVWDGGTLPEQGDDVFADNRAVTVDQNVTVSTLRTTQRSGGTAGGSFATSGSRTVNANTIAGTTTCLTLNGSSTLNGTATGGSASNARGVVVNSGGIHNGDSIGGSNTNAPGCLVAAGGVQNGNSMPGSAGPGTIINEGGLQNGNSTGGASSNTFGTRIAAGGVQNGDSFGGSIMLSHGTEVFGGIQNGTATGGAADFTFGTTISGPGIKFGPCIGGSGSGSHGCTVSGNGGLVIATLAAGDVVDSFGIRVFSGVSTVIIENEAGIASKSLLAGTHIDYSNHPFVVDRFGPAPADVRSGIQYGTLDEFTGNMEVVFDASSIRAALGLAEANMDTQLTAIKSHAAIAAKNVQP